MIEPVIAAFTLGLMGAGHCLGMCGGVTAALAFANQAQGRVYSIVILLAYNLGRIASYALIGGLAALVAGMFEGLTPLPILRALSGVLLIGMGLYLADWWRVLSRLEKAGGMLWRFVSPLAGKLMPVKTVPNALLLGFLWGWLPCGLVYSALVYAAVQANFASGGAVMLAFGVGTLPAVFAGGLASGYIKKAIAHVWVRRIFGIGFIGYGVYTLIPVANMLLVSWGLIDAPPMMMDPAHCH
ncbi:sulfite exporter TauE/SafE family protein [Teredinibacter turnerae]|uniref:sulfite exporter TauE/SafE family protein n=1 Tax=Teredinibacter turnerae TaxID=2426 RepID=UPI00036F0BFE|nr:sulfite exporter TauE/SafE family protein [Teredinibacter turnerae]